MQDEQVSIPDHEESAISQRSLRLINYLESLWQSPHGPSPEVFKRIMEFIVHLPEPFQTMAMTKIAEYLASNMGLHFLDIMATFQQKAADEGISREDQAKTFRSVLLEMFPEIMGLSKHIVTRSLDDLVTLCNITFSLYTLSQVDSAEDAQSWMFELPIMYSRQLRQEHLITPVQTQLIVTKNSTTTRVRGYTAWDSSLPNPNPIQVSSGTNKNTPTLA
jgi:hypothetical protein